MSNQIDKTLIINPAEVWPEPSDCPTWPLNRDAKSAAMNGPGNRQDAEQRLAKLHNALHGDKPTRAPSDAERQKLIERHFTGEPLSAGYSGAKWQYEALGMPFIRDCSNSDNAAGMVVEAAHIRGYLRKLDAKAEADAKARAAAEDARLRDKAEGWPAREKALQKELDSLAEAEARHKQALEDEQAARRCVEIRQQLRNGQQQAQKAAAELEAA